MRQCVFLSAVLCAAGTMFAETITLATGESKIHSVPAEIVKYDAPPFLSVRPISTTSLKLQAGERAAKGELTLVFANGHAESVTIEVLDNMMRYIRELRIALPGYAIRESDGAVTGEVASRAEWEALDKTLSGIAERRGITPKNLVKIKLTDEVQHVRALLEDLGYVVKARVLSTSPLNELAVTEKNGGIEISGRTYSDEALEILTRTISEVRHLAVNRDSKPGEIGCIINVPVDKYLSLTLRVAVVTMRDEEMSRYGTISDLTVGSLLNFDWSRDNGTSSHSRSRSGNIIGNLGVSSSDFLAGEGAERGIRTNSIRFTNHAEEVSKLEVGGTLMVNTGGNSDDGGELKELNFGLDVEVKGGLIAADAVACKIKIKQDDAPEQLGEFAYSSGKKTSVDIPNMKMQLGKTYVLSNNKEASVKWTEPTGVPILRHIPLIKWFFSTEDYKEEKVAVLLLVSPILTNESDVSIPESDAPEAIIEEVNKKVK